VICHFFMSDKHLHMAWGLLDSVNLPPLSTEVVPVFSRVPELDHVGLYVHSMQVAAQQYERLGFQLTALSQHSSQNLQTGAVTLAGVGNRCAMLRKGYLELVAIVDPTRDPRGVAAGLQRYEGLHILALRAYDVQATCAALRAEGFDASLGDLRRTIDLPEGPQVARFTQVRTPAATLPEATVFMLRHETPELLWREPLLEHPNGAQSLDEVLLLVAESLEAVADRYARYLGVAAQRDAQGTFFALPHGVLRLISPQGMAARFAGVQAPVAPFAMGYVVGVSDVAHTAAWLQAQGVPFTQGTEELWVAPEHAGGACVVFRPAAGAPDAGPLSDVRP
jgi:hypothetical protein